VHAHPRFLAEWKTLLTERGMKVDGATSWPTAEQLAHTDVIVAYAQEGGDATPEQERLIEQYVQRGGGLVVIHTAAVSLTNPPWWKKIIGGSWVPQKTKWREGRWISTSRRVSSSAAGTRSRTALPISTLTTRSTTTWISRPKRGCWRRATRQTFQKERGHRKWEAAHLRYPAADVGV
jgi:hypothetical protein